MTKEKIKLINISEQDILGLNIEPVIELCRNLFKEMQDINTSYEFNISINKDSDNPIYINKNWIKYITAITKSCPAIMFFLTTQWRNAVLFSVGSTMEGFKNNKPNLMWEPKKVATFLTDINAQLNSMPFLYDYGDKLIDWVKYQELVTKEVTKGSNTIPIKKTEIIKIDKKDIYNLNMKNIYNTCKEIIYTKQDINIKYILITSAFDDDNRELYCIPQWIKYIKLVMEKYPTLIFFMEDEYKELIFLSIIDIYIYLENRNKKNADLINEKILYFLKNLTMQMVESPSILSKSREIEWENFLDYFSRKINLILSL